MMLHDKQKHPSASLEWLRFPLVAAVGIGYLGLSEEHVQTAPLTKESNQQERQA